LTDLHILLLDDVGEIRVLVVGTFRWHKVLVLYEDKTVVVSVDSHVERMTLEHNSWRFRLAPSIFFGGAGRVLEHRRGCCGTTAWNNSNGSAPLVC